MHGSVKISDQSVGLEFYPEKIGVNIPERPCQIGVKIAGYQRVVVYGEADPYTGAYEVTPKMSAQTLNTKKKVLSEDISVKGVPVYETSNTAGGKTFYIARED